MTSLAICLPVIPDIINKNGDSPRLRKTSPRNVQSPRPELTSGRRRRDLLEPNESKVFASEFNKMKNSNPQPSLEDPMTDLNGGQKNINNIEEGITLDKYFGSTFQKVNISSVNSNRENLFPYDPVNKKRGTVIQENFEIKETDAEDEEYDDSRKEIPDEIELPSKIAEQPITIDLKASKLSSDLESFTTKARKTLASFSKKANKDANDDEQFRITRNIKEFIEKSPYRKSLIHNSKSPIPLRKTKEQFYVKKKKLSQNCLGFETETTGRSSIENIKPDEEMTGTKKGFRQTFGTSFYNKANKGNNCEISKNQLFQNEADNGRNSLRGLEIIEERRAFKENKFMYQNALLTEKIIEDERMLLTKYGTKFGINTGYYNERHISGINIGKNGNSKAEKPRTPFQMSPRQRTFHKSNSGKNLLMNNS